MPSRHTLLALLAAVGLAAPAAALAQQDTRPANEQVVVPQVDRRDVRVPKFPSKDFEVGAFTGTYATQNFGASLVGGLRVGYHVTEDIFVQATIAQTKVSDESFRQILPGGVFAQQKEALRYFNLSAGYNVLPGEVFIGRNTAKPSQFYLIAGVGSTRFVDQRRSTINLGFGMRVFFSDRFAAQVDMRDHVFALDLLGKKQNTQNLELTAGLAYYF